MVEGIITNTDELANEQATEEGQGDKQKDDNDDYAFSQFKVIEGFPVNPSFESPMFFFVFFPPRVGRCLE